MARRSEQAPAAKAKRNRSESTTYEVFRKLPDGDVWARLGRVKVPSGSKRSTVAKVAMAELTVPLEPGETAGLYITNGGETVMVSLEQPAPQLRIGTA